MIHTEIEDNPDLTRLNALMIDFTLSVFKQSFDG